MQREMFIIVYGNEKLIDYLTAIYWDQPLLRLDHHRYSDRNSLPSSQLAGHFHHGVHVVRQPQAVPEENQEEPQDHECQGDH